MNADSSTSRKRNSCSLSPCRPVKRAPELSWASYFAVPGNVKVVRDEERAIAMFFTPDGVLPDRSKRIASAIQKTHASCVIGRATGIRAVQGASVSDTPVKFALAAESENVMTTIGGTAFRVRPDAETVWLAADGNGEVTPQMRNAFASSFGCAIKT